MPAHPASRKVGKAMKSALRKAAGKKGKKKRKGK